ncbi:maleylpyruvate isomerase family mycothiol-dependent enzyme [Pseudonocardiaceae bacterium YIM PH 21723]|nr:maleylpyruvate isomerase family mycothiol-dependent enzyme [Pseudonocardiaceae bacterium YIM PH 21723]
MADDVWSMVYAERAALIDDLEGLREEQWATPSPCTGWSAHDVAAHLIHAARMTRLGFLGALIRARRLTAGDAHAASAGGLAQDVSSIATTRIRLTAVDADLSIGHGPEISGTALALLLAMSGRPVDHSELSRPGITELAATT